MVTAGVPSATGKAGLELRQSDERLALRILTPDAVWKVIDTATPRNEWDSPNPGTCMAAFEVVAPESGELSIAVLFTPGSCQKSARATLKIKPLEDWSR